MFDDQVEVDPNGPGEPSGKGPTRKKKTTRRKKAGRKAATRKTRKKATRKKRTGLVSLSTAELRAEIRRRLNALETQRHKLLAEVEVIEEEIASVENIVESPALRGRKKTATKKKRGRAGVRAKKKTTRRRRPENIMSLVDAMKKALGRKTMGNKELAKAVKKTGYRSNSANFRSIVNQTLVKNKKVFKRVERGMYAVKR